jgi:uncharacterized membrane protein
MCAENLLSRFVEKTDDTYYTVYLYNSEDDVVSVNMRLVEAFDLDVIVGSELEISLEADEGDDVSEKGMRQASLIFLRSVFSNKSTYNEEPAN